MATIVEMINPLTGLPEQVDKLDHTAQEIDDAVGLAPQLSNPNLIDNWYFAYPVNQRNVSGTIDAVGYFLDRWKLVSGSVTIGSNGITLNGTIVQILETEVGTDVTASALTTEGVVVASYDNNSKTISLTGTGQTFVAAKLELGSQQTLAHKDANGNWALNEIPNYGEQLRRCQRYFVCYKAGTFLPCVAYSEQGGWFLGAALPITGIRTSPVNNIGDGLACSVRNINAESDFISKTISNWGYNSGVQLLRISGGENTSATWPYIIRMDADLTFSADL